jgi:threonine/homoserine/homoserine lactone efflux protein
VPFVIGSVMVTIVPGQDMALITRQVLVYGQRTARATIAGNVIGLVGHTVGVAFGLSAILVGSARVFEVVKLLGAAYLVYLGLTTIFVARASDDDDLERRPITRRTAFRQGFLSTFARESVRRWLERTTGAVLVALGVRVALSDR